MGLGTVLLTSDAAYAKSAHAEYITDSDEQHAQMRQQPGLVLMQEGLVRDFISAGNRQVRRNLGLALGDRIVLKLVVSPEVWWALHYNLDLIHRELLVEDLEINQVDVETAQAAGWEEVTVGDKKGPAFTLWATCEKTTGTRLSVLAQFA